MKLRDNDAQLSSALLICMALASPLAMARHAGDRRDTDPQCGGEPCAAVFRGFFAFFDRDLHGLDGNGRACADCHMLTEHFQLSPAAAESRFRQLQWRRRCNPKADDPLFRPIDADDFRINGDHATRLQQPAAERPDPRRVRAAGEYPADRSGHQRAVG